mgnify:CR=1 FL=1
MNLTDIVALAKAGYTPKQVKELLEMVETSPAVKEATVEDTIKKPETPIAETVEKVSTQDSEEDPVQTLISILKGEN